MKRRSVHYMHPGSQSTACFRHRDEIPAKKLTADVRLVTCAVCKGKLPKAAAQCA